MKPNSLKTKIAKYLEKSVKYRDDDKLLELQIWQEYGFVLTPNQRKVFMTLPSAETISRRRRELREKYPESEAVFNQRIFRFKETRDEYSKSFLKRMLG